jgi:DNA-binding FadR family transcriptional regulator
MLESEAAALATVHATDDDLETLRAMLERVETSETPLDRVRDDLAFHAALVGAAHNPVIEAMFASIEVLTVELMVRSAADADVVRQSDPYHRVAYEAVCNRDAGAASAAIRAHLGIAASTYGDGYDQPLDSTAARALRLIGSGAGIDEFLNTMLTGPASQEPPQH